MGLFNAFMLVIIGQWGVIAITGIAFFIIGFKNSERIFNYIKDKTYGTRDFIKLQAEFLHWKIRNDDYIVYFLMAFFFGVPFLLSSVFVFLGFIKAAFVFFFLLQIVYVLVAYLKLLVGSSSSAFAIFFFIIPNRILWSTSSK